MRGYLYGDIKEKLLGIRAKHTDKIIKCYIITKSLNVYAITRISKRNVYWTNELGEEEQIKESILDVYENIMEVYSAISRMKLYYESKIQNLYKVLHRINEIEKYFSGFGR